MKLLLDLPKLENRILELYQTKYAFKTKQESILDIIKKFKSEFKAEELKRDWRNDNATKKQLEHIKSQGINLKENISKYEASIIIRSLKRGFKK